METRNLFKTVFGKDRGISLDDIKRIIVSKVNESPFFEYKRIKENSLIENQENRAREIIMPELVAFLNKINNQGGILVLGVDAKHKVPTEIIGIETKFISDETKLRDWIINDILSVPNYSEFPTIEIESIDFLEGKRIYLIEVHPKDMNVIYFTRTDNCAYKREVDTTRKIPLEETVRLVENKKIAKLFIILEESKLRVEGDTVKCEVKVVFNNSGHIPAFYVTTFLLFNLIHSEGNFKNVKISFSRIPLFRETSNINTCLKSYEANFSAPFYPSRRLVQGYIDIEFNREDTLELKVEIDEQKGRSNQTFLFTKKGMEEITDKKIFTPYVH